MRRLPARPSLVVAEFRLSPLCVKLEASSLQSFCRQIAARSHKTQPRSAQAIARSTYRTDAKRTSGSFGALGEAGGLDWLLGLHKPNPANAQSSSPVETKLLKVVASESSVSAGTLKLTYFGAHNRTRGAMTFIIIAHTCTYHTVHMTGHWLRATSDNDRSGRSDRARVVAPARAPAQRARLRALHLGSAALVGTLLSGED